MLITPENLDGFVAQSDAFGGPGTPECEAYWQAFVYRPAKQVDEALDPFGEAYVAEQLDLYREVSGRDFDQHANEQTALEVDAHVAAPNPYDHRAPGGLAAHVERLSRALRLAAPPRPGRMLDMGCGWGLSSEIAGYCGLNVEAIDINPDFVTLVNRRAERSGLPIHAVRSDFDGFDSERRFDIVLFYECFHHALRPWALAARMARLLVPGGALVLAGEPINQHWWRHWGLRLDPMSVYCIRKFGWFESGWSQGFLRALLLRAGYAATFVDHPEEEIGWTVIARRQGLGGLGTGEIAGGWGLEGWLTDGDPLTFTGLGSMTVPFPAEARAVQLRLHNYRDRPLALAIRQHGRVLHEFALTPGETLVELDRDGSGAAFEIEAQCWVPDEEIGNGDRRSISFHLLGATFV